MVNSKAKTLSGNGIRPFGFLPRLINKSSCEVSPVLLQTKLQFKFAPWTLAHPAYFNHMMGDLQLNGGVYCFPWSNFASKLPSLSVDASEICKLHGTCISLTVGEL